MRGLCCAILYSLLASSPAAPATAATVTDWITIAESSSPVLAAEDARITASVHEADAAGNWPAPEVGYAWYAEPVQTRVGPQEHRLSVTQPLPVFGQPGLRAEVARAQTLVARARRAATHDELGYRLSVLWNELWLLDRALDVAREDLELVESLHRSALSQYGAGRSTQAAVTRIELERDRAADDLRRDAAGRAPLLARINAELGRDLAASVPVGDAPTGTGRVLPPDSLRVRLQSSHQLLIAQRQSAAARRQLDLSARERWPRLDIGVDYIFTGEAVQSGVQGSGQDAVLLRAALRVPWPFEGVSDQTARSRALVVASVADESGLTLRLRSELETAYFEFTESGRRLDLLETVLVPGAERALAAVQAAFASGESGVADLLETRRVRLDLALEELQVTAQHANAQARLDLLTATSLTGSGEE